MNIVIGVPPSQRKGNQWYKRDGNVLDIEKLATENLKTISYFKTERMTRGGYHFEEVFYKTLSNGYMVAVDISKIRISVSLSNLPVACTIKGSNKREFENAKKKVMKIVNL